MENWNWLRSQLTPPRFRSWQTLTLIGLVLWLMSAIAVLAEPDYQFQDAPLTRLGWLFFFASVVWWQSVTPWTIGRISLGPAIIAAVFCSIFLQDANGELSRWVFLAYPLLVSLLVILPYCVNDENKPRLPASDVRPGIALKILLSLLCSCWIQFTFVLQDWVATYPSLRLADFSESQFVVRVGSPFDLRGYTIARTVEAFFKRRVSDRSWSEVERLLLEARRDRDYLWQNLNRERNGDSQDRTWYAELNLQSEGDNAYRLTIPIYWQHPWLDENWNRLVLECRVFQDPMAEESAGEIGAIACNTDTQEIFGRILDASNPDSP